MFIFVLVLKMIFLSQFLFIESFEEKFFLSLIINSEDNYMDVIKEKENSSKKKIIRKMILLRRGRGVLSKCGILKTFFNNHFY